MFHLQRGRIRATKHIWRWKLICFRAICQRKNKRIDYIASSRNNHFWYTYYTYWWNIPWMRVYRLAHNDTRLCSVSALQIEIYFECHVLLTETKYLPHLQSQLSDELSMFSTRNWDSFSFSQRQLVDPQWMMRDIWAHNSSVLCSTHSLHLLVSSSFFQSRENVSNPPKKKNS